MHRRRFAIFGGMLTAAMVLAVATAAGEECSNADFSGRYAIATENYDFSGRRAGANIGTLSVDGAGTIGEWKQTSVVFAADGGEPLVVQNDFGALIASVGNKMVYEVGADCQVMLGGDFGAFELQGVGVLANGGKVLSFHQTTSPNGLLASGVFRSVEPGAADELAELKRLLDRVAVRNGLRP